MRTSNGGQTWASTRITPQFDGTRDFCNGGDPSVAYSRRDGAFYLTQLCFFRALAVLGGPRLQVARQRRDVDAGPTARGRRVELRLRTGTVDDSIFNDKEYLTVDNNPTARTTAASTSPTRSSTSSRTGSATTARIQLAYTDRCPTSNPSLTVFSTPRGPGRPGRRRDGSVREPVLRPVVENDGTLDVAYVLEECNTSLDHGSPASRSRPTAGSTFLAQPGADQQAGQSRTDNPDPADLLPAKNFRAPNTPSLAYSPATGKLVFVYPNYINKATVGGGHLVPDVHRRRADLVATQGPSRPMRQAEPAPNDQFFPWIAADPVGATSTPIWLDSRLDPGNHLHRHVPGDLERRRRLARTSQISTAGLEPGPRVLHERRVHRRLQRARGQRPAVYPVWTDGRDSAIDQTGIGETDIFTNANDH